MKFTLCLRVAPVHLALFLCAVFVPARAATYYVATSGSDAAAGTSWTSAKQTIQAAVNLTANGDLVLVSNGVYATGARVPAGLTVSNRVVITNAITVQSLNGPAVTSIVGANAGDSLSSIRCVYLGGGVLSGFTLSGGYAPYFSPFQEDVGGGAFCSSSATLTNCILSGNAAYAGGGAYGLGTLIDCTLSNNTALMIGGGAASLTVKGCVVSGNTAGYGGGLYSALAYNSEVTGNTATNQGGGLYQSISYNCTITGNTAAKAGGGDYLGTLANDIVYFNTATVSNNYSGSTFLYSCTTPLPKGAGNLTNAPLFVAANNLALQPNSPGVDAGDNAYAQGSVDLDGYPRIMNLTVDMGAHETLPVLTVNAASGRTTGGGSYPPGSNVVFSAQSGSHWIFTQWSDGVTNQTRSLVMPLTNLTYTADFTQVLGNVVWYVATSGNDSAPGTSWATAKQTIQEGVYQTLSGDTVLVSNGVYSTGATVPAGYTLPNRVVNTNAITLQSANGPAVTQISGFSYVGQSSPSNVRCLLFNSPGGTVSGFTFYSGGTFYSNIPEYSTFDEDGGGVWAQPGVVITNCVIGWSGAYNGAGVYGGSLNNCTITNCDGYYGGGVCGSSVANCFFYNDHAAQGGGAYASALTNCTLQSCNATLGGGAASSTLHGCTLESNGKSINNHILSASGGATYQCTAWNCTLTGNGSTSGGGASCLDTLYNCQLVGNTTEGNYDGLEFPEVGGGGASQSILVNCLLSGNVANEAAGGGAYNCRLTNCWVMNNVAVSGGGIYGLSADNCTIWNNTATFDAGGGCENSVFNNSIVYGNHGTATVNNYDGAGGVYSCTTPSLNAAGCITNDPQFVSTVTGDLHLLAASPCIDAGNNAYVAGVTTDYDGNPRINHGTVDMGASEFQGYWAWAAAITNSQTNITNSATGDGYPNLLKYATGSSPTNADTLARLSESLGTNNVFSVVFNHNPNANDVTIYVEQSGALNNGAPWTDIATNINGTWVGSTNVTETGASSPTIVSVADTTPASTNRFFRLRVTKP